MMGFNVLHISDIHYGADHAFEYTRNDKNGRSFADAVQAALRDSKVEKIDCAVITGDLFCSDQPTEVQFAISGLKDLLVKLDLEPNKVMIVPGNHDLTWKDSFKINPFVFFEQVVKDVGLSPNSLPEVIVHKTGMEKDLAFVLLNSCCLEGKDTAGYGRVGEKQIDDIQQKLRSMNITADSHYILAAMHHHLLPLWPVYPIWNQFNPHDKIEPLSYSATLDARGIMNMLTDLGAVGLLHGHQHRTAILEHVDRLFSEKKLYIFSAGSAGVIEKEVKRHFFVYEILPGEIKVWSYQQDMNDLRRFRWKDTPVPIALSVKATPVPTSRPLETTPVPISRPVEITPAPILSAVEPANEDQKRGQSLWQLGDPHKLVIVISNSSQTPTGGYDRPTTGIGQVRALMYCIESLARSYTGIGVCNVLLSDDPLSDRYDHDLLVLGGPKTNKIANKLLEELSGIQPAVQHESSITWRKGGGKRLWPGSKDTIYNGEVEVENRKVKTDYGLIIRAHSPFAGKNRRAILLSGSHTYGTMAASKFFVEALLGSRMEEDVRKKGKNFTILIKCNVHDQHPTNLQVVKKFFWLQQER